jgi:hypothetical protein
VQSARAQQPQPPPQGYPPPQGQPQYPPQGQPQYPPQGQQQYPQQGQPQYPQQQYPQQQYPQQQYPQQYPPRQPQQYPPGAPPYPYTPRLQQPMQPVNGPIVRLMADNPSAKLQMMRGNWTDICRTPCGVPVDPNGMYRVGGGSIRASEEFRMPRPGGMVDINAHTGSTVKHWVGFGMILGGAGSLALGALEFAAASGTSCSDIYATTSCDSYKAAGIVYVIVGVVLLAIGIPFSASHTSVSVN